MVEQILIYADHAACIASAVYMMRLGELKAGATFFIGFLLQLQAGVLFGLLDTDFEAQGACWAAGGSYYGCLPLWFRVIIHLGQTGTVLVGTGVFLAAKGIMKRAGSLAHDS